MFSPVRSPAFSEIKRSDELCLKRAEMSLKFLVGGQRSRQRSASIR